MKDKRLYHAVAARITRMIEDGTCPPGSRLPGERELAEMFDVSRVTIREAEIELQALGRIEIKTGSGVYVLDPPPRDGATLPEASAFELTEARLLFESEAAALAAEVIDAEQLEFLEECIQRMVTVPSGHDSAGEEADRDFHLTIAAASGNTVVQHTVNMLWQIRTQLSPVKKVYDAVCTEDASQRGHEHTEILDALRARDAVAARAAMRRHFRRLLESMLDVTEEQAMADLRRQSEESRQRFLRVGAH